MSSADGAFELGSGSSLFLRQIRVTMLEERDFSDDVFELVSDARESLGKALSIVREEQGK